MIIDNITDVPEICLAYFSIKAPVLNRFRYMMRSNLIVSFDVRDSAAYLQDAVVGTG
jgi:hypothetical protein